MALVYLKNKLAVTEHPPKRGLVPALETKRQMELFANLGIHPPTSV